MDVGHQSITLLCWSLFSSSLRVDLCHAVCPNMHCDTWPMRLSVIVTQESLATREGQIILSCDHLSCANSSPGYSTPSARCHKNCLFVVQLTTLDTKKQNTCCECPKAHLSPPRPLRPQAAATLRERQVPLPLGEITHHAVHLDLLLRHGGLVIVNATTNLEKTEQRGRPP